MRLTTAKALASVGTRQAGKELVQAWQRETDPIREDRDHQVVGGRRLRRGLWTRKRIPRRRTRFEIRSNGIGRGRSSGGRHQCATPARGQWFQERLMRRDPTLNSR